MTAVVGPPAAERDDRPKGLVVTWRAGESISTMLRRFRRKLEGERVLQTLKYRRLNPRPSARKKQKERRALKRWRRDMMIRANGRT